MTGEEMAGLMTEGLINGILQGFIIMAPYIIGFCVLCVLLRLVKGLFRSLFKKEKPPKAEKAEKAGRTPDPKGAYCSRWIFSYNEKDAYRKLQDIAGRRGYIVFAKVRLLDLVEPIKGIPKYRSYFNRIQAKHVDFVLCDAELVARIIVELDDNSHNLLHRKERDKFIDEVLESCGYRVIHTRAITPSILN